jgi:3-hydroxy acid dehydrogenase / malonic semialdehyde reductase
MRRALIVGASSGIGAATARSLVNVGWRVILCGRQADRLRSLQAQLGNASETLPLDVTDQPSIEHAGTKVQASGAVDAVVFAAGHDIGGGKDFREATLADALAVMETNALGAMRTIHALLPVLSENGGGHLVVIGSINSVDTAPGKAAYTASKFALHGLTKTLREEWRTIGVRVTEILPGTTRTEFASTRWRGDTAEADRFYSEFESVLEPDDVARAVQFALDQPEHMCIEEITIRALRLGRR